MYKIIGGDGNEYGPVSEEQLRNWIREGRANGDTKIRSTEVEDSGWHPLSSFVEFASEWTPPADPASPPPLTPSLDPGESGARHGAQPGLDIAACVNASIDLKRRASVKRSASLDALQGRNAEDGHQLELTDETGEAPMAAASRHELEAEIQRAITRLSPKMRAITVLRYLESLSYEEISESLGVSLGTVKSRLSRAHDALDRELTPVLDKHLLR